MALLFHCLLVELEFGMLVLWKEENQRHRRKTLKASTWTNNKLNPHVHVMPGLQNQTQATPARGECPPPPSPFYPFVPPLLVSTNKRLKKIDFKEVWVHFQIVTLNCSSCTLKLRKLIHTCLASCGWVQSTHLRNLVNAWKLKENSSKNFLIIRYYNVLLIPFTSSFVKQNNFYWFNIHMSPFSD